MTDEEIEEEPAEKGGNGKMMMILMIVNIMAVLGVLVYLVVSRSGPSGTVVVAGEAVAAPEPSEGGGPAWTMDPLIVNLRVPEGTRYLKVALEFELTGEKYLDLADQRKNRLKDQIIEFLSDLTVDDVVGSEQKQYIKERLLTRLNHSMEAEAGGPVFRRVFFPEFLVQ